MNFFYFPLFVFLVFPHSGNGYYERLKIDCFGNSILDSREMEIKKKKEKNKKIGEKEEDLSATHSFPR